MKPIIFSRTLLASLTILLAAGIIISAAYAADSTEDTSCNWNFERVGTAALPNGNADPQSFSKLAPWPNTDGNLIYSGCYDPAPLLADSPGSDRCFTTIDVSNPEKPSRLATVFSFDTESSPSPPKDHIVWHHDYPFPNLPARSPCKVDWNDPDIVSGKKAPPCWDPGWNTHTHYVSRGPGKVLAVNQERYRGGTDRQANYHGVKFYDVSDPASPKFLSYWEAPASAADPKSGIYPDMGGTHHFNFDGRYLYLGTEYKGYIGKILVILDVADPKKPVEVSHWALPGQKTPEEDAVRNWEQSENFSLPVIRLDNGKWRKHVGMHYPVVYNKRAYLSYHQAGLVILDVSNLARPKMLSHYDYLLPGAEHDAPDAAECSASAGGKPAACGNAHSARIVAGKDNLLVMTDEYFNCPFGHMRIFDVSDPARPVVVSHFMLPENTACDSASPSKSSKAWRYPKRGPSTHLGNSWNSSTYFLAWYGAGVRAVDISDPMHPKEAGRYMYKINDDYKGVTDILGEDTYDVILGPGNYMYVSDGTAGLRVIRYTGPNGF
jgi:hypothetical protein